jgi:thiol-disulfide isomerase/thioredoxin
MKITFPAFSTILLIALALLLAGRYIYTKPRFVQGERAPDFSAVRKDGQSLRLSDLRGNYVLLDFWGSWCGPCRAQSPGLVALYRKYGGKNLRNGAGFQILSIGVERDAANWETAIAQDGLSWPTHILDQSSSLRFLNGPIATLYKVRQIPTTFLINPDGYIMGVNLSPEEIDKQFSKQ